MKYRIVETPYTEIEGTFIAIYMDNPAHLGAFSCLLGGVLEMDLNANPAYLCIRRREGQITAAWEAFCAIKQFEKEIEEAGEWASVCG